MMINVQKREKRTLEVLECEFGDKMTDALHQLASGDVAAVRFSEVVNRELSPAIMRNLESVVDRSSYRRFPHMETIGMSFFEAVTPELEQSYFSEAPRVLAALRQAWAPKDLPTDIFLRLLQAQWPGGAGVLQHPSGRLLRQCLARTIQNGSELLPHVDRCDWYGHATFPKPYAQLSGNIYVANGDAGGELLIWDQQPEHPSEPKLCECSVSDDGLGLPDLVLAPRLGEMILINSQLVHAVRTVEGLRCTLSFFLVLQDNDSPLLMYH